MRGINKVILVGVLGANPIPKQFQNGGSYAQFSIATSEKYQDKRTGDWIENTE
ncbi:single-stranded DNA-binding protein, partial [Acinetobacter baumannii]|nr:single-stranded DNA-binding protein [Acinetobacter baumannii]